jgi:hypothetical protein
LSNSEAIAFCLNNGCESGDSNIGSRGSKGVIKCAKMQTFGSETSRTDKEPFGFESDDGAGSFKINKTTLE